MNRCCVMAVGMAVLSLLTTRLPISVADAFVTLRRSDGGVTTSGTTDLGVVWGLLKLNQHPVRRSVVALSESTKNSFMDRLPGENEKAFFRRVTAAASDPALFQKMVLQENDTANSTLEDATVSPSVKPNQTRGYVRAEDWDAEEQRRKKSGELTWDERVQFEGQMYGNRVLQNDILRQNLLK